MVARNLPSTPLIPDGAWHTLRDFEFAVLVQPLSQVPREVGRHVLSDEYGDGKVARQRR